MALFKFTTDALEGAVEWDRIFLVKLSPYRVPHNPVDATLAVDLGVAELEKIVAVGNCIADLVRRLKMPDSGFQEAGLLYVKKGAIVHIISSDLRGGTGWITLATSNNHICKMQVDREYLDLMLAGINNRE
jgi:hypothetical protein